MLGNFAVDAAFSTSNGERLLHVSRQLFPSFEWSPWYLAWQFHPLNPWFDRFDWFHYTAYDAGLTNQRIKRSRYSLEGFIK